MQNKLTLSRQKFKDHIVKKSVSGTGLEENPYLIKGSDIFNSPKVILKNLEYYLIVKESDITSEVIFLRNCSNIKFIGCSLDFFFLYKCHNIEFINCSFQFLHLSLTYKCSFSNCTFKRVWVSESKGNSFKGCEMPLDSRSRITSSIDSFRNTTVFLLVGVIGLCSTLLLSNEYLRSSPFLMGILAFGVLVLVISVLSLIPKILLLRRIKRYDRSIVQ